MKKTLFSAILLLAACGSPTEETKQDINEGYEEKATTFLLSKIENDDDVLSFDNLRVDSVSVISPQTLEHLKMQPLISEYSSQIDYAKKLKEIDETFGSEMDATTRNAILKVQELGDSLERWEERAMKLNNKDTLGYEVRFLIDLTLKDGSKSKDKPIFIRFDKDRDINSEWN